MATPVTLKIAIGPYEHVRALRDGSVRSERVRFDFVEVDPITRAFRRMARDLEFDVSEMAITTHALAHAFGKPITALPIVLSRGFHHGSVVCVNGSSIRGPVDLVGRKVGVRAWSQTTGVWIRGIMKAEYGVEPSAMTTVTEEDAHVREYQDPPYVVRAAAGKTLRGMLNDGEVDAAIALRPVPKPGEYRTVIPDADAAAAAWFRKTGVYPVNHVVSVKTSLLREHPWLGAELLALFTAAKERARAQAPAPAAGSAQAKLRALVGDDTLPYGMAKNRAGIEMLLKFAAEQTLTPRVYRPEELFDPGTLSS
jgi:4,5-dihydroxyphthalate decarboxylase